MKNLKFHQFIFFEKGPVNTAIIDFLKGNVFQVENKIIKKFVNKKYVKIVDFIKSLRKENLIIELDEKTWIPRINFNKILNNEEFYFTLEIEDGANLNIIKKFHDYNIKKIFFYGEKLPSYLPLGVQICKKKKDFSKCYELSKVDGEFGKITQTFYDFNMRYNSCWGRKITITKDHNIRPCIYSKIVVGNIDKDNIDDIIDKIQEFWAITKDKIEKCMDCELKYICFDCREIARNRGGSLFSTNPYCNYNPYTGKWK